MASYREFTAASSRSRAGSSTTPPRSGRAVKATLAEVVDARRRGGNVAAIGITNQRETVVAWDRDDGQPYGTGDRVAGPPHRGPLRRARGRRSPRRSSARAPASCSIRTSRHQVRVAAARGGVPVDDELALGTIDSWLIWNLTGGEVHATDPSQRQSHDAVRHRDRAVDRRAVRLLARPDRRLPEVRPSSGRFGVTSDRVRGRAGIPISGIAGDQQAALFGQACFDTGHGQEHVRHGQLRAAERRRPSARHRPRACSPTVAWELADGTVAYALEGAIFVTGAAIQWLRDGIDIIDRRRARSARSPPACPTPAACTSCRRSPASGVAVVGSVRRGTIVGITRGTHAGPRRPAPSSSRWRTRRATSIDAMVGRQWHPDHRSACRRWRVGDGPPVADAGRSARRAGAATRSIRRRPRSAPPSSPVWPRASGPTSTRSPPAGSSTPRSSRPTTARSPISSTPNGYERSSVTRLGFGERAARRRT